MMNKTEAALSMQCDGDLLNTAMKRYSDYTMYNYLPLVCCQLHHQLAISHLANPLVYPSSFYEAKSRASNHTNILKSFISAMSPSVQHLMTPTQLNVDFVPLFLRIITPNIRPVSPTLLNDYERKRLDTLVGIYQTYGITFKKKLVDRETEYIFSPPIDELCDYKLGKEEYVVEAIVNQQRKIMSQQVELAKLRLQEEVANASNNPAHNLTKSNTNNTNAEPTKQEIPKQEAPKKEEEQEEEIVEKDFFGRVISRKKIASPPKEISPGKKQRAANHPVYFKFHQGFTNAVRRNVYIKDLT